ncbi:Ras family protein [Ancylostoma ceylanicum]|uniref:Ras family protein n=1 Tax=Ancylostoma ceylanicum TaxID=53326 RepID=A0A0D6M8J6_9BILA|nr:Ras family protein [Ancylostoma ceylanicum]
MQVAVPYPAVDAQADIPAVTETSGEAKPSTVQESFAITPNDPGEKKPIQSEQTAATHHKKSHKLPLAPTSSKGYIAKRTFKVQLWDTAGQESPSSFASLRSWINECEKNGLSADSDIPRILIGNKCDLKSTNSQRVDTDAAQMFADRNNMALFETSAKADSEADHVESIFLTLLHKLQQSKPMHVQSEGERQAKEQERLVLKASEANALNEEGWLVSLNRVDFNNLALGGHRYMKTPTMSVVNKKKQASIRRISVSAENQWSFSHYRFRGLKYPLVE